MGLNVGVAGGYQVLDEGVVGRDVGGGAVAIHGREEDQPELVAPGKPGGDEAPVLEYDGRTLGAGVPRHGDVVGLGGGVVVCRNGHGQGVGADAEVEVAVSGVLASSSSVMTTVALLSFLVAVSLTASNRLRLMPCR